MTTTKKQQGEANAALTPHVLRKLGYRNAKEMHAMAQGLGIAGTNIDDAPARAADLLADTFAKLHMPARLRDLQVPEEGLPALLEDSMKNFNADPKREFLAHRDELMDVLKACW